jgi:hypothetical protein
MTRTQEGHVEPIIDYMYATFPMIELDKMVEGSNIKLTEKRKPLTNKGEQLKWIGIRLVSILERRRGNVRSWFDDGTEPDSVLRKGNYAALYGMTATRFIDLNNCMQLRPPATTDEEKADRWYMLRSFLGAFNERRRRVVTPGQTLVLDESMSAFRQKASGDYNVNGMPHLVKIARKSEGVGAEFKDVADPYTGIILFLELQEGRDAMRAKEWSAEYGAGAACTLRMTRFWHGSGRTVIADSWFGSFICCIALWMVGLYSIMMVKTAYRFFPLKFLKRWAVDEESRVEENGERIPWGNHKVLRRVEPTTNGPATVYALGHRDRKLKTIITNKGTTLPGAPMSVERSRIVYDNEGRPFNEYYLKTTPRCRMMEMLFDDFSVIDIENHRRQGVLRPEKYWLTKCWWKRCFASIGIGMCVVDAYLLYKCDWEHFHENGDVMDMMDFSGKLAYSLIHNQFIETPRRETMRDRPLESKEWYQIR